MDNSPDSPPVRFDTRVAVVLREDLLSWQKINVAAFLTSGITVSAEDLTGEPYVDADGTAYLPMLRQPVLVFAGTREDLHRVRTKAVGREMAVSIYTSELFVTDHDAANRAAVAAVPGDELDLVGVAIRGPKNPVDRIVKGLPRHD